MLPVRRSKLRQLIVPTAVTLPVLVLGVWLLLLSQEGDPSFDARVEMPAYPASHPRVLFDEAHYNVHTADSRYKPFADLIRNDGYVVASNSERLSADVLRVHDVLVIANALGVWGAAQQLVNGSWSFLVFSEDNGLLANTLFAAFSNPCNSAVCTGRVAGSGMHRPPLRSSSCLGCHGREVVVRSLCAAIMIPLNMQAKAFSRTLKFEFRPLSLETWPDVERLFGPRGACGGCWCMAWRVRRTVWDRQKGAGNKRAFKKLAVSGNSPGILAYAGNEPIGWCAVAPRSEYVVLERSRVLKPVDDQPVWSVTCFYIARAYRRRGASTALLREAVVFAKKRGARIVEGYPVELKKGLPDVFAWTGLPQAFAAAGFKEVARRSPTRPIMRYLL